MLVNRQKISGKYPTGSKGEGLVVEDCVVYGGSTAVEANRSQRLRFSRNVLKAGLAGLL